MSSVSSSDVPDGPVLNLITKKLRALKKKYNRIIQLEESQAQGKTLNKEQEDLLKSKLSVSVLIDEFEKLRQPLAAAVQEELSRSPSPPPPPPTPPQRSEGGEKAKVTAGDLEDLLPLLYFGCLFDVKSQTDFASSFLTKTHERGCCLTYDYVTDDATDLLGEGDLDMISALSALLTSRPVYSGVSHKNALEGCIERAKLWLENSDQPIVEGTSVTYAGLREKLKKIMALDYFTMTPEMKAPVDVAAAVGKYNSTAGHMPVAEAQDDIQVDDAPVHYDYQHKEDEQGESQAVVGSGDQSSPPNESENVDEAQIPSGDSVTVQQEQERVETDMERSQRDPDHKEQQQYVPRRGYQNQRGGRGGGGGARRGYPNGRGGRGGRGGGSGRYQNGQNQQYYDSGYYPRNYHNNRGRGGGRSSGSAMYNNTNHGGQAEVGANS